MTEFKIGDKVLVKPGEVSRYGWAPKDYTTPLTVSYEQHDGLVAVLAGVLEYSFRPEQLTPAPLDPSKVKPGDTVTVRVEEEYAHTTHPAYTISDTTAYGDPVMVGPFVLDQEHITLLDHQPAPEPEPEWKPGTVLLGNLPGPYPDDQFWVVDDGETNPYVVDDTGVKHYPADLLNVREAVVIDPVEVDVTAIGAALRDAVRTDAMRTLLPWEEVARIALAEVGIEVPR